MLSRFGNLPTWAATVTLGAGDSTKTIKAAPGAGKSLYVTKLVLSVVTSAAQAVDVEDSSGTVEILKLPASATGQWGWAMDYSVPLTANEALVIKPAAAGPAIHVIAEGYVA